MRALAEYVMRGRSQAVMAAALATGTVLFAWVGAAVIALVTLRKGLAQGGRVLAWAMLPALLWVAAGSIGPTIFLLGVMVAAVVLRATGSWPWSLTAATIWGVIVGLLMVTWGTAYIDQSIHQAESLVRQLMDASGNTAAQQGAQPVPKIEMPSRMAAAGAMGLESALASILCLMLARWWQATLYNPGGFRSEFHSLRLPPPLAVGLLGAGIVLSTLGVSYGTWSLLLTLPFMFAGLGLVHGLVARKGLGRGWLGLFYFFLFLLGPLQAALVLLAVADSWLDFRGRIDKNAGPGS